MKIVKKNPSDATTAAIIIGAGALTVGIMIYGIYYYTRKGSARIGVSYISPYQTVKNIVIKNSNGDIIDYKLSQIVDHPRLTGEIYLKDLPMDTYTVDFDIKVDAVAFTNYQKQHPYATTLIPDMHRTIQFAITPTNLNPEVSLAMLLPE